MDKVKFSLRNVHYAPFSQEKGYETPVKIPGSVSLSIEPQGEVTPFYADGIVYYQVSSNNGYSGDLEVAYFLESFLKDIYGYKEGETSKVLTEYANIQPRPFALLGEEEGDTSGTKFVFYNCAATRPKRELKTKEDKISPSTQTISITMAPLEDGRVFALTGAETPEEVKKAWYTKVYEEERTDTAQAASRPTEQTGE